MTQARRAAALLALVTLLACGGEAAPPAATPATPAPPAAAGVLVIGIDGAGWDVLDHQPEPLPQLAALQAEGAKADLATLVPTISPAIWTTIATGKPPEEHGIQGFQTRQVMAAPIDPGGTAAPATLAPALVTSNMRRAAALWSIATERGLGSAVFGWWGTWPAEPVKGILVSDRLSHGKLPKRVHPDDAAAAHDHILAETSAALSLPEGVPPSERALVERWARNDRALASMAKRALADPSHRLVMVYLRGLDPIQHRFWKHWRPEGYDVAPSDAAAMGPIIPTYIAFVDGLVGELAAARAGRAVIVLSDHGMRGIKGTPALLDPRKLVAAMGDDPARYQWSGDFLAEDGSVRVQGDVAALAARLAVLKTTPHGTKLFRTVLRVSGPPAAVLLSVTRTLPEDARVDLGAAQPTLAELSSPLPPGAHSGVHDAAPPGILLVAGPGVARGASWPQASVFDAAPLVLHFLGLPLAQDMPGKLPSGLASAAPAIASYETGALPSSDPIPTEYDDSVREELRSLGYVQ